MQRLNRTTKFFVFICVLLLFCLNSVAYNRVSAYTISQSECCIEADTGIILHENNANKRLPMASTTKIATAITVIENANLDDIVYIKKEYTGIEGSSIYLKEGDKYTVRDLLYGLMLRSGNDSAVALACHVGKDISHFCSMMNALKEKLGLSNTNFCNPHGLHDENHYTTAYDLAKISAYAIKNPTFKQIVSTQKINVTELTSGAKRTFINKNKMLYRYPGSTGIKTGYTKKAGRCLVSSADKNGMNLVCVVLNSPQMFERSEEILDECSQKYNCKNIINKSEFEEFFSIDDEKILTIDESIKHISKSNTEDFDYTAEITFTKNKLPIKKGKNLGKIDIYSQNQLIYSQKIYTLLDITDAKLIKILKNKAQIYQRCINENK